MTGQNKPPLDDVRYQHPDQAIAGSPMSHPQTEPLHLSGVWRMESTEQADALLAGTASGFVYRREGHPNASSLAEALRIVHGADESIVTAQGMSAISIAAMALLKPGDRVRFAPVSREVFDDLEVKAGEGRLTMTPSDLAATGRAA